MNSKGYIVNLARWPADINPIREVRTDVFIDEQHVTPEEEWDGLDDQCLHALAWAGGEPIATGRLLPDGKIGRMAVRKSWRGRGVGAAILKTLMDEAQQRGFTTVKLAAQTHAMPFYEKFGFKAYSDEFLDANMPHYWMRAELQPAHNEEASND